MNNVDSWIWWNSRLEYHRLERRFSEQRPFVTTRWTAEFSRKERYTCAYERISKLKELTIQHQTSIHCLSPTVNVSKLRSFTALAAEHGATIYKKGTRH
jgi:hypothetical protein